MGLMGLMGLMGGYGRARGAPGRLPPHRARSASRKPPAEREEGAGAPGYRDVHTGNRTAECTRSR